MFRPLQHLETFLWQRNPAGISRISRAGAVPSLSRVSGVPSAKGRGGRKTKTTLKSEKTKQRAALVKKVSTVLRKLETLGTAMLAVKTGVFFFVQLRQQNLMYQVNVYVLNIIITDGQIL